MPAPQFGSAILGVAMVTAPTLAAGALPVGAMPVGLLALLAVLAGLLFRPAATLAVLLAVVLIAWTDPAPGLAALSGLCAALYLVLRHAGTVTVPTAAGIAGFTAVGLVATAVDLRLPWLPLLAPLAVVGIYLLAIHPLLGRPPR